ncbi:lipoyl(octanoyl) transferase LipB [Sphingorhabdus sp. Alg239-R122]|uniref:lipoyl(octanoyl) transferase LipB n=1 Tax=Sphingorhabdus sp. Alg239-R122 TaxID=2305989 RepID=UPI0013D92EC4|nr:lipoyl(octanoyl) transferase LipB [Sphingorhabdus sp. Alg239-R122]
MNDILPLLPLPQWEVANGRIPYPQALEFMEKRNADIRADTADELVWLIEHPPLYTAGTSADPAELLSQQFPVYQTGRGGRHTYHGPGQRVGYVMLDLRKRGRDVRVFVHALEGWVIATLADFGVEARRAEGRIGIWTDNRQGQEAKIGAIGVRIKSWVTMHGFAVNIDPDLSHFGGIVPCGISEYPVTSLAELGIKADMGDWDAALKARLPCFLEVLPGGKNEHDRNESLKYAQNPVT